MFDIKGNIQFISQYEFKQFFPRNGWVEHNPNEIWSTTLKALKRVIKKAKSLNDCKDLFKLHNEKEMIKNSFSQKEVSFKNHLKWFKKKFFQKIRLFISLELKVFVSVK